MEDLVMEEYDDSYDFEKARKAVKKIAESIENVRNFSKCVGGPQNTEPEVIAQELHDKLILVDKLWEDGSLTEYDVTVKRINDLFIELSAYDCITIFRSINQITHPVASIDLHYQKADNAMDLVHMVLKILSLLGFAQFLRIIVGKGKGSTGEARIRKKVIEFLDDENMDWEFEDGNDGVVVVTINKIVRDYVIT